MKEENTFILPILHQISRWIGTVLLVPAVIIFLGQVLWLLGFNTVLVLPYGFIFLIFAVSFLAAPSLQKRFFEKE